MCNEGGYRARLPFYEAFNNSKYSQAPYFVKSTCLPVAFDKYLKERGYSIFVVVLHVAIVKLDLNYKLTVNNCWAIKICLFMAGSVAATPNEVK